jgi:hypothetical protein
MKKWGLGIAGFVVGLVIVLVVGITLENRQTQQVTTNSAAASKAASKADQTTKTGTSTTSQSTASSSTSTRTKKSSAVWNSTKAQKLNTFMSEWGSVMDQQYEESTISSPVSFYGLKFPQDLSEIRFKVNESDASIEWSNSGTGNKDYELVAVYSDAATAPNMGAHLYFFALHQGSPVTLITQQTNGDVQHEGLYFKPTANKSLSNGFATIIDGGTPHM